MYLIFSLKPYSHICLSLIFNCITHFFSLCSLSIIFIFNSSLCISCWCFNCSSNNLIFNKSVLFDYVFLPKTTFFQQSFHCEEFPMFLKKFSDMHVSLLDVNVLSCMLPYFLCFHQVNREYPHNNQYSRSMLIVSIPKFHQ